MITGFVVLAVLYYDKLNLLVAGQIDFEQILHFYFWHFPIDELKNTFFGLKKDPCLNE